MQTRKRFTTATKRILRVIINTSVTSEKEDDKYKKFYNFVFDLYVVWLLVF